MDILVLALWFVVLLILHTLLIRFLEMKEITQQIMKFYYKNDDGIILPPTQKQQYAAQHLPEPNDITQELPVMSCETPKEISMEEELMNYVYNYQDPVLDNCDKKITIDQVSNLTDRLTPIDASNVIGDYTLDAVNCDSYESYNNFHDKFSL